MLFNELSFGSTIFSQKQERIDMNFVNQLPLETNDNLLIANEKPFIFDDDVIYIHTFIF
jgi:hypothetical protein